MNTNIATDMSGVQVQPPQPPMPPTPQLVQNPVMENGGETNSWKSW